MGVWAGGKARMYIMRNIQIAGARFELATSRL